MALGSMKLGSMDLHFFYDFYPKLKTFVVYIVNDFV